MDGGRAAGCSGSGREKGTVFDCALLKESQQEKAAVEQAQAAAKPQAQEWNQRFFQELSRQEKVRYESLLLTAIVSLSFAALQRLRLLRRQKRATAMVVLRMARRRRRRKRRSKWAHRLSLSRYRR